MFERVQQFYTAKSFAFLQIASMCLQTTLLIVLTSTCAITGNVARSKKCVVYFDSPIEDVPTTGHRPHAIVACPAP